MTAVKPRGRPRKTNPDAALHDAMTVFWEKGYEATSLTDLVSATGMAKPSLYATFGDKEAFFLKTLSKYLFETTPPLQQQLATNQGTVFEDLKRYLDIIAHAVTNPIQPGGCFAVNCLVDGANAPAEAREMLDTVKTERIAAFKKRMLYGQECGELDHGADLDALAEYLWAQSIALAVLARAGDSLEALSRITDLAMVTLKAAGGRR